MGWNSTVVVLNDCIHDIENDPEFGKKLADAIRDKFSNKGRVRACNGVEVIATHHADSTSVLAVGGNFGTLLAEFYGPHSHHEEAAQIVLLRALAQKFGFTLKKEA